MPMLLTYETRKILLGVASLPLSHLKFQPLAFIVYLWAAGY